MLLYTNMYSTSLPEDYLMISEVIKMTQKYETTSDFIAAETVDQLYPYQVDRINREIRDLIALNASESSYHFEECPKCHSRIQSFMSGGYTYANVDATKIRKNKLLKCPACHHRFTVDH